MRNTLLEDCTTASIFSGSATSTSPELEWKLHQQRFAYAHRDLRGHREWAACRNLQHRILYRIAGARRTIAEDRGERRDSYPDHRERQCPRPSPWKNSHVWQPSPPA